MTTHHNEWDTSAQWGESSRSITSSSPEIAALTQQISKINKIFLKMCQPNQQVNTGLPEFSNDTVTDYSRPSPAIESTSDDVQNKNPSVTETGTSDSTILSKPIVKFVKAVDRPAKRPTTNKVKTAKKSTVKYAELYRKPSKKSTVRGNQRN
nr:hypothetical protein [Tanacetum cinerariifolium]